jgi:hypothetical protein
MTLVAGVHHVTFLTEDIERLAAFSERVFAARTTFDETEEGVRRGSTIRTASMSKSSGASEWKTVELRRRPAAGRVTLARARACVARDDARVSG